MEGNLSQPVILGVIPDNDHPSPVTDANYYQSIIRTHGGNQLVMDDKLYYEQILLSNDQNYLLLDNRLNNHQIIMESQTGKISASAGKDINLKSDGMQAEISGNQTIIIKNQQNIHSNNIINQARNDYLHQTQDYILQTNDANLTAQDIKIAAKDTLQLSSNSGDINIKTAKGSGYLHTKNTLSIQGQDLILANDHAQVTITKNGDINIVAKKLHLASLQTEKHTLAGLHSEPNITTNQAQADQQTATQLTLVFQDDYDPSYSNNLSEKQYTLELPSKQELTGAIANNQGQQDIDPTQELKLKVPGSIIEIGGVPQFPVQLQGRASLGRGGGQPGQSQWRSRLVRQRARVWRVYAGQLHLECRLRAVRPHGGSRLALYYRQRRAKP